MVIESAAVMGWFVILVLGEKYVDDATRARRVTEDAAQDAATSSASLFCVAGNVVGTGFPELAAKVVPPLIAGLGIPSLPTLPSYTMSFRAADISIRAGSVHAAEPLDFRSGQFSARHTTACLEPSLDLSGAPWVHLKLAREGIFITNIMGY